MSEHLGWLLDLYEDPRDGIVLWFVTAEGSRLRLHQPFPVTFYAAGENTRLRELWKFLEAQPERKQLSRTERTDLFQKDPVTVLAIKVAQTTEQAGLFRRAAARFPDLDFFDADLQVGLRYAAVHNTFPMAYCRFSASEDGLLQEVETLDTPWTIDPVPPPLRTLYMDPDCDPQHAEPTNVILREGTHEYRLPMHPARPLLINLRALFERIDPDLLVTSWGDTWMLTHLAELGERNGLPLPFNRDADQEMAHRAERSYFSYGQIIFSGRQTLLFGRCHIDQKNAIMWKDYGLDGALEIARVTTLPLQTAARVSPGTGISSMQILVALRTGVLVPWRKQQAERPKTALDLLHADQGGLVYQPITGLHSNVGEVDFISMYPSIMVRCNISPEKKIPTQLGSDEEPGLIPQTLRPLLEKRVKIKERLGTLPPWDPRRKLDKARSSAHKWLLVTCFGYLGYKNARFGRIEAHEAVTTWGREALLRAKEAAEDMGFTILHMYVDGLWVQKKDATKTTDFNDLLLEIANRTSLPVALDGVYRWVAFLPSRVDSRVAVPNRYFGVFQDGSMKLRGIEARRRDMPAFITDVQMELLVFFGRAATTADLFERIPMAVELLRRRLSQLRAGKVTPEKLLVAQRLSRELNAYVDPSPAARAARQIEKLGKDLRPGQRVRFIYMRGEPGVHAWDLPDEPDQREIDVDRYREMLLRAASAVFQPVGVEEITLREWVAGGINEPLAEVGGLDRIAAARHSMLMDPAMGSC